ncbi:MAG: GatB/YqeY domain-containing protein [Micropruina sp.]|nr:MAG: GatB/YqeY domain-containing protein [Micropruina sp.]
MAALKDRLQVDLVAAIKAHDEATKSALRMALAAIGTEEVAGKAARELSEAEELTVLTKEVAKRKDSAEAYAAGGRDDLVAKELRAAEIVQRYLPAALSDAELDEIVADEVAKVAAASGEAPTMRSMGPLMKAVGPRVAGRANGSVVAAKVRAALT